MANPNNDNPNNDRPSYINFMINKVMNIIIDQYRQDFPESWGRVANWEDMEEDDRDIVINLEISKTPYPDFLTTVRYIMKTPGNHTQSAESNGKALDKFLVFFAICFRDFHVVINFIY